MNKQQIIDLVKGLLVGGGPAVIILTRVFGMQSAAATDIVSAIGSIVSVAGLVWIVIGRSDANNALVASEIPGVQVHAKAGVAPESVVALAEDTTGKAPDVVPMTGPPVP